MEDTDWRELSLSSSWTVGRFDWMRPPRNMRSEMSMEPDWLTKPPVRRCRPPLEDFLPKNLKHTEVSPCSRRSTKPGASDLDRRA